MKIYIDVSVLTLATFVTGIQRVTREITIRLIEKEQENVVLLHYNARDNVYHRHGTGVKNKMITRERIELSDMTEGDVFFDLDAAWMCRVKRSWLLPLLKKQGVRIVAHIYDIISITHPQYCLEFCEAGDHHRGSGTEKRCRSSTGQTIYSHGRNHRAEKKPQTPAGSIR